jgi:hypothetical protein
MSKRLEATLHRLIQNTARENPGRRRSRRNPPMKIGNVVVQMSMNDAKLWHKKAYDQNSNFENEVVLQGITFEKPFDLAMWAAGEDGPFVGAVFYESEMYDDPSLLRAVTEAAAEPMPGPAQQSYQPPPQQPPPQQPPPFGAASPFGSTFGGFGGSPFGGDAPFEGQWEQVGRSVRRRQAEMPSPDPRNDMTYFQFRTITKIIPTFVLQECLLADKSRLWSASADTESKFELTAAPRFKQLGLNRFTADSFINYSIQQGWLIRICSTCRGTGKEEVAWQSSSPAGQSVTLTAKQVIECRDCLGGRLTGSKLSPRKSEFKATPAANDDAKWNRIYEAIDKLKDLGFTGCDSFANDPRKVAEAAAQSKATARRGGRAFNNPEPSYMIPLQFPTERYIYAPDSNYAHWTSSPVWAQATFYRNNPRKLKVPDRIPATPREDAEHISAIGKKGQWPIGDLYHARMAMIYIMSPSHSKVKNKVIAAVQKHYPEYDWMGWLDKKERALEKKHAREYRAAANPGGYLRALDRDQPRHDDTVRALNNPRGEDPSHRMFTISRGNPKNPFHEGEYGAARKNPQGTPIPMPTNAGPYLPDMFPYGVGGRPAALENPNRRKRKKQ